MEDERLFGHQYKTGTFRSLGSLVKKASYNTVSVQVIANCISFPDSIRCGSDSWLGYDPWSSSDKTVLRAGKDRFELKPKARGITLWFYGDVTRDESQRRFLPQHSVATLLRHCSNIVPTLFQHCNDVLRWKSSLWIVPCNITFMLEDFEIEIRMEEEQIQKAFSAL